MWLELVCCLCVININMWLEIVCCFYIINNNRCFVYSCKFCENVADAGAPVLKTLSLHQFQQNSERKTVTSQAIHGRKELSAIKAMFQQHCT